MKSSYKSIDELVIKIDERNTDENISELLGLSIDKCFIKSVANTNGTDLSKYKIIRKRDFAVSLMQVSRDEKIPIAMQSEYDAAIMSPAYPIFRVKDTNIVLPEYLEMWFKRPEFDREAAFIAVGGVRGSMPWNEFAKMKLPVPSIDEQKNIVKAHKTITDRIALKQQINDNLEEQVYALYKQLTQVHDPNTVFESIATVQSGKRPVSNKIGNYPLVGAGGIMSYINDYNFDEQILITGRVGTHGVIQRFFSKCWASDNTLVIKSDYYEFSYHFLKSVDWDLLNRGSTQPLVTQTDIKNLPLYLPNISELTAFEATAEKIMKHQRVLLKEIESLNKLKDMIITSLSKH